MNTELAKEVISGSVRAAARACRMVDDEQPGYIELLKELFPATGKAWIVGVTGSPGSGKSTLVDRLIELLRARDAKVAVVAVDPTSPFSGGAILGDRIRMQRHEGDPKVFIRSLATRGALGGLSRSARDVVRVLDAWGADVVLVETVGVGQDELEITRTAHTTLVVMAPGMGDDVQAIKAGLLECADVFAVNKADHEGADATVRDLEVMIALGGEGNWASPIQKCVATKKEGIPELLARLDEHRVWVETTDAGHARREERLLMELTSMLSGAVAREVLASLAAEVATLGARIARREIDPYSGCEELIRRFRRPA